MYEVCSPCRGRSELSASKRREGKEGKGREGTTVEHEAESRHLGNNKTNITIPTPVFHSVIYRNPLWVFCPTVQ